ncbi:hypothetical protein [Jannaschia pohangensis]|uniref:Uncharacterized protein n=1 Tax=Jannaschia pohangensis TaxID=390807 RepID=A0A1I3HL60_9RHOB|nr:hypothetical protein [Jannaschia pohangensis]SFI36359.1 hypothetical protein SAMN04488095_0639 [Jannaschia pohangensis]
MGRWIALLLLWLAAPAIAQMPTCGTGPLPCEVTWVENGSLTTIRLKLHTEDFVSDYAGVAGGIDTFLTSDIDPTLRDFDQDGRIDVGLFEPVGMVNGDLYLFRRTDNGFEPWGVLNGDLFTADKTGVLVTNGRSSCCERGLTFHAVTPSGTALLFGLRVRPEALSESVPQCEVVTDGSEEAIRRDHGAMIADYCRLYEEDDVLDDRTVANLRITTATRVDATTVFACILDNGKRIRLSEAGGVLTYSYGAEADQPELSFDVPVEAARIVWEDGSGASQFSHVELPRGGYRYRLEHGHQLSGTAGSPVSDIYANLSVTAPDGALVFDRYCDPRTLFGAIDRMGNR